RHEPGHQPGEALYSAIEGRIGLLASEALSHLPKIGLRARGENGSRRRTALNAGAQETEVRVFDGREVLARSTRLRLLDRHGFAGEGRLDDEQVFGREQAHV